jgi:ubiquinone biosynthesis accessory factor UbiJ
MEYLNGIDKVINKLIALDNDSMAALKQYKDKQFNIELENTSTVLSIRIEATGLRITNDCATKADVIVRGTPLELLNHLMSMKHVDSIQSGSLEISGDISLAQNFQSILRGLDVDWEDQLAVLMGDSMAHKAARVLTGSVNFLKNSHVNMNRNISEYLRYEKPVLINSEKLDEFSHSINRLRDDTARLKARIERIDQIRKKR